MTSDAESPLSPERRAALAALFADLPTDFHERYEAIETIRHAFHRELASALQDSLNTHLASLPQDSPDERKELTAWLNLHLRQVGLAVRCPVTGLPARLQVDNQDANHPETTRFRFSTYVPGRGSLNRCACKVLPELELVEATPRVESLSRAFKETGRDAPAR